MKKYDVIIVGAGPAGLAATKILEKTDLSFCVIEKNKFPRLKLCGGGLTIKSQKALKALKIDLNIDTYTCNKVEIRAKGITKEVELDNQILMVDRTEFDHNNFMQVNKNNIFLEENIIEIEENILKTDKDSYEFKYIIFADGVNGYSRRLIQHRELGFCVEYDSEKLTDKTILDFKAIEGGYAWIFPKKNSTTIGLGNINTKKNDYINLLVKFACENNFEIDKTKIRGYHIPIYSKEIYPKSVIDNKYILIGDAASLVDPISGEGIYYALMSGKYASESIIEAIIKSKDLKEIYYQKTKNLSLSLDKRKKLNKLLYSKMGPHFIKLGLTPNFIGIINRLFG